MSARHSEDGGHRRRLSLPEPTEYGQTTEIPRQREDGSACEEPSVTVIQHPVVGKVAGAREKGLHLAINHIF